MQVGNLILESEPGARQKILCLYLNFNRPYSGSTEKNISLN